MWYHLIGDKMTLNNEFIEEYKRLDRLCRGIYNSDKGITNYIDDMRSSSQGELSGGMTTSKILNVSVIYATALLTTSAQWRVQCAQRAILSGSVPFLSVYAREMTRLRLCAN